MRVRVLSTFFLWCGCGCGCGEHFKTGCRCGHKIKKWCGCRCGGQGAGAGAVVFFLGAGVVPFGSWVRLRVSKGAGAVTAPKVRVRVRYTALRGMVYTMQK